jgi:hypothetical protein
MESSLPVEDAVAQPACRPLKQRRQFDKNLPGLLPRRQVSNRAPGMVNTSLRTAAAGTGEWALDFRGADLHPAGTDDQRAGTRIGWYRPFFLSATIAPEFQRRWARCVE